MGGGDGGYVRNEQGPGPDRAARLSTVILPHVRAAAASSGSARSPNTWEGEVPGADLQSHWRPQVRRQAARTPSGSTRAPGARGGAPGGRRRARCRRSAAPGRDCRWRRGGAGRRESPIEPPRAPRRHDPVRGPGRAQRRRARPPHAAPPPPGARPPPRRRGGRRAGRRAGPRGHGQPRRPRAPEGPGPAWRRRPRPGLPAPPGLLPPAERGRGPPRHPGRTRRPRRGGFASSADLPAPTDRYP